MKKIVLALGVSAMVAASAGSATAEVKARYYKGQPIYFSVEAGGVLEVVAPPSAKKGRVAVAIGALNRGPLPVTLGYENISVRSSKGTDAKLISFDALQHDAKRKAFWEDLGATLLSGLNSYAASQSAHGEVNTTVYGYGSYGSFSATSTTTYVDPTAAQFALSRARAENERMFTGIAAQLERTLQNLDAAVLRTTTVDPGQFFGGIVVFELPKGATLQDMQLTVTFNGETHRLSFGASPMSVTQVTLAELARLTPATTTMPSAGGQAPPVQAGPVSTPPMPPRPRGPCLIVLTDPRQNQC